MGNDNGCNAFPTEILCSSPKSNSIIVYLSIKKEDEILNELNYEDVYNDIYNWLKKRIENTQKAF